MFWKYIFNKRSLFWTDTAVMFFSTLTKWSSISESLSIHLLLCFFHCREHTQSRPLKSHLSDLNVRRIQLHAIIFTPNSYFLLLSKGDRTLTLCDSQSTCPCILFPYSPPHGPLQVLSQKSRSGNSHLPSRPGEELCPYTGPSIDS